MAATDEEAATAMCTTGHQRMTSVLLCCGAVAGPWFLVVVALQEATRTGFDPGRHPLSLLSLGGLGWLQVTNFVVTGLLNLAFAAGLRRRRMRAGALPLAGHGFGLIVAGVFVRDPGNGYPPGIPAPVAASWHHVLHGAGAVLAFGSLIGACAVFARRFAVRGNRGWAGYCGGTGVALAALLAATRAPALESPALHLAAVAGWLWASALAAYFLVSLRDLPTEMGNSVSRNGELARPERGTRVSECVTRAAAQCERTNSWPDR